MALQLGLLYLAPLGFPAVVRAILRRPRTRNTGAHGPLGLSLRWSWAMRIPLADGAAFPR